MAAQSAETTAAGKDGYSVEQSGAVWERRTVGVLEWQRADLMAGMLAASRVR